MHVQQHHPARRPTPDLDPGEGGERKRRSHQRDEGRRDVVERPCDPTFGVGNAVAALVSLGEFGPPVILPLFLQSLTGYTALETGVILLALAAGSFIASGVGAGLARRVGPVPVVRLGVALEVVGVLWIPLTISVDVTGWMLEPGPVRLRGRCRSRHPGGAVQSAP